MATATFTVTATATATAITTGRSRPRLDVGRRGGFEPPRLPQLSTATSGRATITDPLAVVGAAADVRDRYNSCRAAPTSVATAANRREIGDEDDHRGSGRAGSPAGDRRHPSGGR